MKTKKKTAKKTIVSKKDKIEAVFLKYPAINKTVKQAREDFDNKIVGQNKVSFAAKKHSKKKKKPNKAKPVLYKDQAPMPKFSDPNVTPPNWFDEEEVVLEADFLDEFIEKRTAKNPKFPDMVIAAELARKSSKELKAVKSVSLKDCDYEAVEKTEVPSVTMILGNNDGSSQIFSFNFFECCKPENDRGDKTYVASCQNTYGEGHHWADAYADCVRKMVALGLLRSL